MSDGNRKRSVTACVAEIKAINKLFRQRPDMPDAEADPLMEQKDRLIDEMAGLCPHPRVIATAGVRRRGLPRRSIRICSRCGFCEAHSQSERFQALAAAKGREVISLPADEYVIRQGLILKKLGINI